MKRTRLHRTLSKLVLFSLIISNTFFFVGFNETHAAGFNTDCTDIATTEISQLECEALGAVYNSLNGDSWTTNTNWGTSGTSVKTWHGLLFTGNVLTRLNLQYNGVTGTLPSEIGNFSGLQQLFLSGNAITGTLPTELGNVTSLTSLRVDVNSFSGEIPVSFSNLTNLQEVRLHRNNFSGTLDNLSTQANLNWMYLEENNFHGEIPAGIISRPNMRVFRANLNNFTGPAPEFLSSGMTIYKIAGNHFDHVESDTDKNAIISNIGWYNAIADRSRNLQSFIAVTIEQGASQSDPAIAAGGVAGVLFDAVFSEPIDSSTFTPSDIQFEGMGGASVYEIVEKSPNDGTHFEIAVTAMSGDTIEPFLPEGSVVNSLGKKNYRSTSMDNSVFVQDENMAPYDITMSNDTIPETTEIGDRVTSAYVDDNYPDGHTLSFCGGADDSFFNISFLNVRLAQDVDFTNPGDSNGDNIYEYCITATDWYGLKYSETFYMTVTEVIEYFAPTAISIDNSSIYENTVSGTVVGNLSSTDASVGDTHTYSLVAGVGSEDNAQFTLSGSQLVLNMTPDFENPTDLGDTASNNTYSVRVQTDDGNGGTYEEIIIISILDIDEIAPTVAIITSHNEGDYETDTTPVISGIGEVGAIITLTIGGVEYTGVVDSSGNWSINITNQLLDDEYSIEVFQTDTSGNVSGTVQNNIIVDTMSPLVSFIDDVEPLGVTSDIIEIIVTDDNLDISTFKYGFVSDKTSCDENFTATVLYLNNKDFIINSEGNNGKYICAIGEDLAGHVGYSVSNKALLIDLAPVITLIGESSIEISQGDIYTDQGATFVDTIDGTGNLVGSGAVDTTVIGDYIISYNTSDSVGNKAIQVIRTVSVVDTINPVGPTLIYPVGGMILKGTAEPGTAISIVSTMSQVTCNVMSDSNGNYSCDMGEGIINEEDVVVTSTDASGNYTSSYFSKVFDLEKPKLTLIGDAIITIEYKDFFTDEGAAYSDNFDLQGVVMSQNSVNTDILGNTDLSYNYTDTQGNIAATLMRTVKVVDNTKPVLTLVGAANIIINKGTIYSDAGAVFTDNYDGSGLVSTSELVKTNIEGEYILRYNYTDTNGNIAETITRTVNVVDRTIPTTIVGSKKSITTDTTATIQWETSEKTSSQLLYGLTTVTGQSTTEEDISPRVISHTMQLTNLKTCTKYYYYTVSTDLSGNVSKEGIYNFITDGCAGNAEVINAADVDVVSDNIGTVEPLKLYASGKKIDITVPKGYAQSYLKNNVCSGDGAYFQFKEIDKVAVESKLGKPKKDGITVRTYDLSAYCTPKERIVNFDKNIIITANYLAEEINGEDEENLGIYRFNEDTTMWQLLENCSVDSTNKSVSCETNHFSTFGIFSAVEEGAVEESVVEEGAVEESVVEELTVEELTVEDKEEVEQGPKTQLISSSGGGSSSNKTFSIKCVTEEHLVCAQKDQGVFSYTQREGISCLGGDLGKVCTYDGTIDEHDENISLNSAEDVDENNNEDYSGSSYIDIDSLEIEEIAEETLLEELEEIVEEQNTNIEGKVISYEYSVDSSYESCPILKNIHTYGFEEDFESKLSDVEGNHLSNVILRLEKAGVVDGSIEGLFEGERNMSRVEFLKVVLRSHCIEYRNEDPSQLEFTDLDVSTWQAKVVKKSIDLGIVHGDINEQGESVFRANSVISRIEATKILMNMVLVVKGEVPDTGYIDIITPWHEKYVKQGEYLNIFDPENDDKLFKPEAPVTRDTMVDFLYKVTRLYKNAKLEQK